MTQHTQVITVGQDGSIAGLQRKAGEGLDLRKLGNAEIVRASEVLWDEKKQKWYVQVKGDPKSFMYDVIVSGSSLVRAGYWTECVHGTAFFDEYDDAVKAEIAYLDWVRVNESWALAPISKHG